MNKRLWNLFFIYLLQSIIVFQVCADENAEIFHSVTRDYGILRVSEGKFTVASKITPWSSWWFPAKDDFLFRTRDGEASPLERYDDFVWFYSNPRVDPKSRDFEEYNLFNENSDNWAGLCDAWALASILEAEPRTGLRFGSRVFRIADLKALLIKSYEGVTGLKQYGQRFYGAANFDLDGNEPNYLDIYPDQFHLFMQKELFEKKLPFLMDYDAGTEVWTVPVYRASVTITRDESSDEKVNVMALIFYADSQSVRDPNYVGNDSVPNKEFMKKYTYSLTGKWEHVQKSDGSTAEEFVVSKGQWTGDSRKHHPDYLIPKPKTEDIVRKSRNTKLDVAIIDKILGKQ